MIEMEVGDEGSMKRAPSEGAYVHEGSIDGDLSVIYTSTLLVVHDYRFEAFVVIACPSCITRRRRILSL